jgi:hypothetical protein
LVPNGYDGSLERDWSAATSTPISGCNVQSFILSEKLLHEINAEREFDEYTLRVWAPPGVDVVYTDRVLIDGIEYDVLAWTGQWKRLADGSLHHQDFMCRRRNG